MIASFAIRNELDDKDRYGAEEQDVNVAAFMKQELQDKPDYKEYGADCPHCKHLMTLINRDSSRRHASSSSFRNTHWEQSAPGNKKACRL